MASSPQRASSNSGEAAESFENYVGAHRCADCHPQVAESHARSGHSQTFARVADSPHLELFAGKTFRDPERHVTYRYSRRTSREQGKPGGLQVTLPDRVTNGPFRLQYAMGSGKLGVTLMTLIPSETGEPVGIEHRVSWIADKHSLALTPGHRGEQATQPVDYFGRAHWGDKLKKCLDCHTTHYRIENYELVDLRGGVQCELCHGPGKAHVDAMENLVGDVAIEFAPEKTTTMEELRLCGRCHRLPESMPAGTLVPTNRDLARFQPAALMQSECFQHSERSLGCSACHDPHAPAGSKPKKAFERTCLRCHQPGTAEQTQCPVSPNRDCLRCHMPEIRVEMGMGTFHDHWIRIRGEKDPPAVSGSAVPPRN